MIILEAKNITKYFSKSEEKINILNKINISITQGEILILCGPSGSGKSTLLNILGTLDNNYSGDLYIENKLVVLYSTSLTLKNTDSLFSGSASDRIS